jgi:alpha-amylase/alpha-mannosidase (GH57 family)
MNPHALCVHAHFYQPPREDPITGVIPVEPGAAPYRNWNERIHHECYRPNAELGNFARISFNIGPTLFEWMAEYDPSTYQSILSQDAVNVDRFGVGNAIAQAYNHTILPLATSLDKETQVRWGIADFEYRFRRKPKGMWLPETAANIETLEVLADNGIEFTILAPWQAQAESLDPTHPYRVNLPNGRQITVFFYHQELSTRVSFDPGATVNADHFLINAILPKYRLDGRGDRSTQLLLIASDGELYGHHQPFREKFLAHLMDGALRDKDLIPIYPARWLEKYPPQKTARIRENSSWSCHHGVLRWSGVCGCTPQARWKRPLRRALNHLAEVLDGVYADYLSAFLEDPWELRHQYISVILGQMTAGELISSLIKSSLSASDRNRIQILLEAQFQRQRMMASCGWFFDDFDRIEPRNNVAYAAQATWLTSMACGVDLVQQVLPSFKPVKSSRTGLTADAVFAYYLGRAQASTTGG